MRAPEEIAWLVEAVGDDAALAFIEAAGGTRIVVPQRSSGTRLEALYGAEVARALCAWRPREHYQVPVCRHWRIHQLYARGLTVNEISVRMGLSRTGVYEAIRRPLLGQRAERAARRDERQTEMF